ncbi:unnamed protein product [Phytomonas sp. EM1]|nr:unnamed protein product [Phytomonas sp. EM1]|eukprot:CCW64361.1 unnamed protein product [Phytomonas sp. isolate EM1]
MYARYRTRSRFYKRPEKVLKAYNVSPNLLRRPIIKKGLLNGVYTDETVDLRDRERLEMLEAIRHPRERDFYQDHTYHNQWVSRELEKHQKNDLASRYRFFSPNYEISPWIWYPGDLVEVVSGEAAGQRGVILAVVKYANQIIVRDINVRDVVIPASEGRPEQILRREHPIRVTRVRHVDPSTGELCHLEEVSIRNRRTGVEEKSRVCVESGVLLPIPPREDDLAVGDPLKDTPLMDAEEITYDAAAELPRLVEARLHAMETYFVGTLREAYEFHHPLRVENGEAMRAFQLAVVETAAEKLARKIATPSASSAFSGENDIEMEKKEEEEEMPSWWREMAAPYVEQLAEEEEEQRRREAAAAEQKNREEAAESFTPRNDDEEEEVEEISSEEVEEVEEGEGE